ncbi:MAG TPA: tetratricopeptide repeat protein, partial [Trebonia sp.]|nr:tetratricopeptide repeat protein [Trebonia sp.]
MSEGPSGGWDSPFQENSPETHDVHAWYTTGMELLGKGSPAAAAQVLQRAAAAEPQSRSVREALARAQFDTGRYAEAADNFRVIVEASPSDDYAHFGLGLALAR